MKPFAKTFRASKIHKATDCGICAEEIGDTKSFERRKGIDDIDSQLDAELEPEELEPELEEPSKETGDYIQLLSEYKELRIAYVKLWLAVEDGDLDDAFFAHRETFRKLAKGT